MVATVREVTDGTSGESGVTNLLVQETGDVSIRGKNGSMERTTRSHASGKRTQARGAPCERAVMA